MNGEVLALVRAILSDPAAVSELRAGLAAADVELIDQKETGRICGISKSEIYRRVKQGTFPKPTTALGPRCTRWSRGEVTSWAAARIAAREGARAS